MPANGQFFARRSKLTFVILPFRFREKYYQAQSTVVELVGPDHALNYQNNSRRYKRRRETGSTVLGQLL